MGGAPGGETPRVADSSAAGAGRFFHRLAVCKTLGTQGSDGVRPADWQGRESPDDDRVRPTVPKAQTQHQPPRRSAVPPLANARKKIMARALQPLAVQRPVDVMLIDLGGHVGPNSRRVESERFYRFAHVFRNRAAPRPRERFWRRFCDRTEVGSRLVGVVGGGRDASRRARPAPSFVHDKGEYSGNQARQSSLEVGVASG